MIAFFGYAQSPNANATNKKKTSSVSRIPIDEGGGCTYCYQWNLDADKDGFGDPEFPEFADYRPINYVANQSDCNDGDAAINPNTRWYADNDLDGLGDPSNYLTQCIQPIGNYVLNNSDNCPLVSGTSPDCNSLSIRTSLDQNYIITTNYNEPTLVPFVSPTPDKAIVSVTYYDGLGRPKQSIASRQGGDSSDIITHIEYDALGRQVKEYLPYASSNPGNDYFKTDAKTTTLGFYNQNKYEYTVNPFSDKLFEASPLNRVLQQAAPGNAWAKNLGHEIKFEYQTNTVNEVKLFEAIAKWDTTLGLYDISLTQTKNYDANQLYKTITKDENWVSGDNNTTQEFKNKEGQVVLKRTFNNGAHDTYYVYDIYGNLTFVLPPLASDQTIATTTTQSDVSSTAVLTSTSIPLQITASNSIRLLDGFHAQSGSTFSAKIISGSNTALDNLCYQYKYDYRNRLVEKKLPGKGWEYIVYDKLDRPILTQDANLRAANKWLFTKYDAFSRPVYTGDYKNTVQISRTALQTFAQATTNLFENKQATERTINGTKINYTNNAFPNLADTDTNINLFTINYYDDYAGIDLKEADTAFGQTAVNSKGLATVNKVRIIGTTQWTTNVSYYDAKARPVFSYSKNDYLGTTDKVKSDLDFVGKVLKTTTNHSRTAPANNNITIVDDFTYDHTGRLLTQTQTINGANPEIIVANTYDELGQLKSKAVGGKTTQNRLQNIDYTYNIRGWLKGINDVNIIGTDLFSFKINYNDGPTDPLKKLYNGNISQTFWKTTNPTDTSLRSYDYTYDALNRLTFSADNLNRYNENLTYDKNGNIKKLLRNGYRNQAANDPGIMDNLIYEYDAGNKLFSIEDSSGSTEGFKDGSHTTQEYTYDANGNMKTDDNKGITAITYNHLNLPTSVTLAGGTINYYYDATGVKQRKVAAGITTDYASGFQYEGPVLKFFPTPEGYVEYNNGTFTYIYQYKDHLGNVRLSYKNVGTTTPSLQIVEESSYYPFGLKQKVAGEVVNQTGYKYKYNGKELQDELGLNFYDYGARNYDAALGRWMNIDPLAEKFPGWSPYSFCYNNPMRFTDPTGMAPDDWVKKDGKWSYVESITTPAQATAAGYDDFRSNGSIINNAKIGSGATGDVYLGAGGDSHYATAEDYAVANGGKSFGNSFWNDTQGGSYLYSGGFNYNSTYAGISGNHQFFTASGFNNTGNGSLPLALDLGGSISGTTGSISGRLGTSNFGVFGNANGSAFTLDGSISSGILTGEGSKFGAMLGGNVGAYTLKGEYSGGFSIGGISMQGTVGGSLVSAHIGINMGTHYNSSNGTFNINFQENVGLGIGEKGAINISIPVPFVK